MKGPVSKTANRPIPLPITSCVSVQVFASFRPPPKAFLRLNTASSRPVRCQFGCQEKAPRETGPHQGVTHPFNKTPLPAHLVVGVFEYRDTEGCAPGGLKRGRLRQKKPLHEGGAMMTPAVKSIYPDPLTKGGHDENPTFDRRAGHLGGAPGGRTIAVTGDDRRSAAATQRRTLAAIRAAPRTGARLAAAQTFNSDT